MALPHDDPTATSLDTWSSVNPSECRCSTASLSSAVAWRIHCWCTISSAPLTVLGRIVRPRTA